MSGVRVWLLPSPPDPVILVTALAVLALGLVMVASASFALSEQMVSGEWHFVARQTSYALSGLAAGFLVYRFVSLSALRRISPLLWALATLLLVLVLVPGIGHQVKGSWRWLDLGFARVQASEFAKLFVLIYLAAHLARVGDDLRKRASTAVWPVLALAIPGALMLAEPDLGAAGVLLLAGMIVLFLSGVRLAPLLVVAALGVLALVAALYLEPYRLARLESFLDPWKDPYGIGFQLTQSLIAVGRGEILGAGLGLGLQKLFYLPEAHTDFIFAVLAEELGLVGVVTLCTLYVVLVSRCLVVGRRALAGGHPFAAGLCHGVGVWFALQALINAGVNLGILPTKGLTLPLVSYGGSSLLVMMLGLAVVLRAEMETRQTAKRQRGVTRGKRTLTLPVHREAAT